PVRYARPHPVWPLRNANHFAGLMEMLVPVAVLYILGRARRTPAPALALLLAAVAVAVAALLLSGSRGGLMALAAEMALLVALSKRPSSHGTFPSAVGQSAATAAALTLLA